MRIAVTGRHGQVARALLAAGLVQGSEVIALGQPQLDLAKPETIAPAVIAARPDVIVNAAAWTAVDLAESHAQETMAVNATAPGILAETAANLGVPLIQLSTDYVFDGTKPEPYTESDIPAPLSMYGRSKHEGEIRVAEASANHVILRTSWVFASRGKNFPLTMLRLARTKGEIAVVHDQTGYPSYAPDIADGILAIASRLVAEPGNSMLRGVFHLAGQGALSWAGFASAVFDESRRLGGPFADVRRIATADYPTAAKRPQNSRLDSAKARDVYGIALPHWQDSIARCLSQVLLTPDQD